MSGFGCATPSYFDGDEYYALRSQTNALAARIDESPIDPLAGVRDASAEPNREGYDEVHHNPFLRPASDPLSTFALDVDTASYTNVRRMIQAGQLPPAGAVRVEDFVNYFDYDETSAATGEPLNVSADVFDCPWTPEHRLMRIAVRAMNIDPETRPGANLVFLVDVSGSMDSENKLPLVKLTLRTLLDTLRPDDRVAIVVYAGSSGTLLESTAAGDRDAIELKIDQISAGGSTHGAAGIEGAYAIASEHFIGDGINRVILCTDGDFNVGISDRSGLVDLIRDKAKGGVYLTVLGFGTGNWQDAQMEALSNSGNGNFAYIDTPDEARRAMGRKALANLMTVARDAKIQVEFNPSAVAAYRLIGYENRVMENEEFNDDAADAGEVGAGHQVTALYEIVPAGVEVPMTGTDELRYQKPGESTDAAAMGELATVKLRYQPPEDLSAASRLIEARVMDEPRDLADANPDARFAIAAAGFAMLLRDTPHLGEADFRLVRRLAESAVGDDPHGDRKEFVSLIKDADRLSKASAKR